jgi:cytosine/adenosine deaminase-related metal-dependent hydrolase
MTPILIRAAALMLLVAGSASAETQRYVVLMLGKPAGTFDSTRADDGTVTAHFEFNDRGRGPKLDATYRVGDDGTPVAIDVHGNNYLKVDVAETFAREGDSVRWHNTSEDVKRDQPTPAFYLTLDGTPQDGILLAQALLRAPDKRLALLPSGEARIERLLDARIKGKRGATDATLYAIHGLDLTPAYIWLDDSQQFFASYSSWQSTVREGYEGAIAQIGAKQEGEETGLAQQRAKSLTQRLTRPLLIRNVRVFDPPGDAVEDGRAVLIDAGRIVSITSDAGATVPAGTDVLDGGGRFLMPGLWDMHVHYSGGADGLLELASGITTVRDLANDVDALSARIKAIEEGRDIGPRIIRAGFVDGRGPYAGPTKVFVDTEDEARKAVDYYAKTGHEQIKIYSSIKPELMPVIARLAHAKGLRVSGHVPAFMTARQFVEGGADEIQHINMLMLNFMFDKVQDTRTPARFTAIGDYGASLDLGSAPVRDFVAMLKQRDIVVDPTVGTFSAMFHDRPGNPGPGFAAIAPRMPPSWQRWLNSGGGGLPMKPEQVALYRDSYQRMVDFVGVLYRSGVRIVAGTDDVAGLTLPRELELYVASGIPPKDVLRIATYDGAVVMKRDKEYGRIAPGYVADLILVDGDPTIQMADIRKVRTVIRGDRQYDSAALFGALGIAPAP